MKQQKQQYPKLERELERQGRKKAWIAKHLRMTRNDLSNRLSGYHNMGFKDNEKSTIARLLGVDVSELFERDITCRM